MKAKLKTSFSDLLAMLFYLAWWKICDIQEFIKRILKKEGNKNIMGKERSKE